MSWSELDSLGLSGSEEEAPAGPEVEVTLTSTGARRRALTARRRWVEAGTTGAEGGRLEEEVHPEEEEVRGTRTGFCSVLGPRSEETDGHLVQHRSFRMMSPQPDYSSHQPRHLLLFQCEALPDSAQINSPPSVKFLKS